MNSDYKKSILYFINGTAFNIICLVKLLKRKKLKCFNFHVPTSLDVNNEDYFKHDVILNEVNAGRLHLHPTDISDEESINETVDKVVEIDGKIDVLVYDVFDRPASHSCINERYSNVSSIFETNVYPCLSVTKKAISYMKEKNQGTIVVINSYAGMAGCPYYSVYSAARHAIEGFIESIAAEVISNNIKVKLLETALQKKTEIDIAIKRAASLIQQENIDQEERMEYENTLTKEGVIKTIKSNKLVDAIQLNILNENNKMKYYMNKQCRVKLNEKFTDIYGNKKMENITSFFLQQEIEELNENDDHKAMCIPRFNGK